VIITCRRFTQIGEALFGPTKWYPVLAQMVGNDRTMVWRLATGKARVTPAMRSKLAILCRARGEALLRLADEIEK
jgi:hypothetical protein